MKEPIKKTNIGGIWYITTAVSLHSADIDSVHRYCDALADEIEGQAYRLGAKKHFKLNVKEVEIEVRNGL